MRVIQEPGRSPLRSAGIWGAAEGQTQKQRGGGGKDDSGAQGDGGQKKLARRAKT